MSESQIETGMPQKGSVETRPATETYEEQIQRLRKEGFEAQFTGMTPEERDSEIARRRSEHRKHKRQYKQESKRVKIEEQSHLEAHQTGWYSPEPVDLGLGVTRDIAPNPDFTVPLNESDNNDEIYTLPFEVTKQYTDAKNRVLADSTYQEIVSKLTNPRSLPYPEHMRNLLDAANRALDIIYGERNPQGTPPAGQTKV